MERLCRRCSQWYRGLVCQGCHPRKARAANLLLLEVERSDTQVSKLTWHFQCLGTSADAVAAASGATYIKVMDPPETNPFPGKQIIGRTYMDDNESNALAAQGAAGADIWFAKFKSIYLSRAYVGWWEATNEPQDIYSPTFRKALVAFTLRLADLLHSIGKKIVALNLSVGAPEIMDFLDFKNLAGRVDAIGMHEYSAPTMQSGQDWYCLRYRQYRAAWAAAGLKLPPIVIGECGLDGGVLNPPRPRTGWKSYASRDEFMAQLQWYDAELAKDPGVLAAMIFTSGPDGVWQDFNFDFDLSQRLARHIAQTPAAPVTPLTLVQRLQAAFGSQFSDERASLPHGPTPYKKRPLSAIERVILHHTATAQTTAWSTVARYHVNSLGWPGVAYHIGVHADGRVTLLNDPETVSYHAGNANGASVAISVVGNYETDTVNAMLWQRVLDVKAVLEAYLARQVPMLGHRDASTATVCPGKNLYAKLIASKPEVPMAKDPRASNCKAFHLDRNGKVDGIKLVWEPVPSARFACISAQLISEEAAQNNTVVTVDVLNVDGVKAAERVFMAWPYGDVPGDGSPAGPGNPNNQFTTTSVFPSSKVGPLGFFVGDASQQPISDYIWGYGLPDARHICGYVVFKERGAVVVPPVVPPVEPGVYATLAESVKGEAERNDVLRVNPTAALCKAGAAAGLWPTSNEFQFAFDGVSYTGQRFRNPANDAVVAFYCVTGKWSDVRKLSW